MHRSSWVRISLAAAALALASDAATAAVKKMFVSSVSGSTDLSSWAQAQGNSGLAAGDAICSKLAENAGLDNFASYRAWLSDSTDDAYCRVAGFSGKKSADCGQVSLPDAGPWQRVDGKPFARSLSALAGEIAVLYPPNADELGATVVPASAHTGTSPDGTLYTDGHCSEWTASAGGNSRDGGPHLGGSWWTSASVSACGSLARLYCFESGAGDPLPPFEAPGALAFKTSGLGSGDLGSWADAGGESGLAAGDAICQARAAAAGLPFPESFLAWLSDGPVDAIDRLTTDGPFKRPDGVRIAAAKANLTVASLYSYALEAAPTQTETGAYIGYPAWTGSDSMGVGAAEHCLSWTDGTGGQTGQQGYAQDTRGFWTTSLSPVSCDQPHALYCFSNRVNLFWDNFESQSLERWSATAP